MNTETTEKETTYAKVGLSSAKRAFEQFVIRLHNWSERRHAKRLYWKIWKANNIIISEMHRPLTRKQNRRYWSELSSCADALEKAACDVKRGFDTDV